MADDANVALMKRQLDESEAVLLSNGIPPSMIIYVVRNGGSGSLSTLGFFFETKLDAHSVIDGCNGCPYQPPEGSTTLHCLAIDARDHTLLKSLIREGLTEDFDSDAEFLLYMESKGWGRSEHALSTEMARISIAQHES